MAKEYILRIVSRDRDEPYIESACLQLNFDGKDMGAMADALAGMVMALRAGHKPEEIGKMLERLKMTNELKTLFR